MTPTSSSILLVGESGVGKTHYGAQLLRRLMKGDDLLHMDGAATNVEPFEAALDSLNEGRAAGHTATATYVDSVWPVADAEGHRAELVWPDYGGEQIKTIIETRRVPSAWQTRIETAGAWLLLIRLQQTRIGDDIFSKPLGELGGISMDSNEVHPSDQARLVELLQMLLFAGGLSGLTDRLPRLGVLLTCWDEAAFKGRPEEALDARLPLVSAFVRSVWQTPLIMGLSALERPLSPTARDMDYVAQGPEHFGYVIAPDGTQSNDLTAPIHAMLGTFAPRTPPL
ncbi:hypothetical protein [Rhizobium leguminosarum]|uniref:TRAFAC clade GTPase domain-containing protein n=1 Tax=Rhizobium TaxID=379 RepID=UPI00103EAAE0|nr:hypothetical protein [Rhizobium leguminosarum]TBZ64208.1 hypothetical protein E0H64_25030 [Rhizobium leguminosarum bv. viciae]